MTERIDHTSWACEFIRAAENLFDDDVTINAREAPTVAENIALAQVHATLALVEQQRIANLIALAHPIKLPSGGEVTHMLHDPASGAIREDVAEGLGL